jgi:response regulator RpfG family c-di-GMP phosphodiesterase
MQPSQLKVMIVHEQSDKVEQLWRGCQRDFQTFKAESVQTAQEIWERVGEMAVIICAQTIPSMKGSEFCRLAAERYPDTRRIVLVGYREVEALVEAVNGGYIFKYISLPWNPEDVLAVVQQAAETYRSLKNENKQFL